MIIKKGEPKFAALLAIVSAVTTYRKHSIIVLPADSCELHGTYWDGGTCHSYALVNTAVNTVGHLHPYLVKRYPQYAPPQFGGPRESPRVNIEPGCAVVSTGVFCGKISTACVTMSQADFEALPE